MCNHAETLRSDQTDHDRWVNYLVDQYREMSSTIRIAVDSFPSDRGSGWNAGVYALTYHEPNTIPEALRKRDIMDDEINVEGVYHGPGTFDDMLTLAYLDAIEYICHTLETISRFDPNGEVSFRTIKCTCRSERWLAQLSNIGKVTDVEPVSEMSSLPLILIRHIMGALMTMYGLTFTFELDMDEDGCGLIGMCEDAFEAEREDRGGKDK